jgi:Zn-dependent peptidase ImmA (M78 family)
MQYKFFSNSEIAGEADNLRKQLCKHPDKLPIDVEHLIEFKLGIDIRPVNFSQLGADYLGMLSHDLKTIFISNSIYANDRFENRLRFTLAHELGHFQLHGSYLTKQSFKSTEEWIDFHLAMDPAELDIYEKNCNEFAGRFLVPLDILKTEINNLSQVIEEKKEEVVKLQIPVDINDYLIPWVGDKLHRKFKVAPKTMEIRIEREKIKL